MGVDREGRNSGFCVASLHDGLPIFICFVFNDTATTEIYTLSLHDALPISQDCHFSRKPCGHAFARGCVIFTGFVVEHPGLYSFCKKGAIMKAIWIIARQNLLILRHDRAAVLWMVVMPLLYIIVFGNAFKGNNDPAKSRAYLAIYAQDKGLLTERLLRSLKSDNIYLDTLSVLPEKLPIRVLTIPDSFTSNILAGHPVTLTLTYRADANVESKMTVVMAVRKAYFRLLADLADLNVHDQKINRNNFVRLDRREPLIKVKKEFAGRAKIIPTGFNHQIPANIVMFTMLVVFLYAGHSLIDEKRAGLLRRIKIAPVSFEQLFLGKLLGITDRKSTRLNSSHTDIARMPSSA